MSTSAKELMFTRVGGAAWGGDDVIVALEVDSSLHQWVQAGRRAWVAAEAGADFAPYEVTYFGSGGAFILSPDSWEEIATLLGMEDLYELEGWESCEVGNEVELAEARADLWITHFHREGIRFSFVPKHEDDTRFTDRITYSELLG